MQFKDSSSQVNSVTTPNSNDDSGQQTLGDNTEKKKTIPYVRLGCFTIIVIFFAWFFLVPFLGSQYNLLRYKNTMKDQGYTSEDKIQLAFESGKISEDEYVKNLIFNTFDKKKLDDQFNSSSQNLQDSHLFMAVKNRNLSEDNRELLKSYERQVIGAPVKKSQGNVAYAASSEWKKFEKDNYVIYYTDDKKYANYITIPELNAYSRQVETAINIYKKLGFKLNDLNTEVDSNKLVLYINYQKNGRSYATGSYVLINKASGNGDFVVPHEIFHQVQSNELNMPEYTTTSGWEPYAQWASGLVSKNSKYLSQYNYNYFINSHISLPKLINYSPEKEVVNGDFQYYYFSILEYLRAKNGNSFVLNKELTEAGNLPEKIINSDITGGNYLAEFGDYMVRSRFNNDSYNVPKDTKSKMWFYLSYQTIKDENTGKTSYKFNENVKSTRASIASASFHRYFSVNAKNNTITVKNTNKQNGLYVTLFKVDKKQPENAVFLVTKKIEDVETFTETVIGNEHNTLIQVSNGTAKPIEYEIVATKSKVQNKVAEQCTKVGTYKDIFSFFGKLTKLTAEISRGIADMDERNNFNSVTEDGRDASQVLKSEAANLDFMSNELEKSGDQFGDKGIISCYYPLKGTDEVQIHQEVYDNYPGFKKMVYPYNVLSQDSPDLHVSSFAGVSLRDNFRFVNVFTSQEKFGDNIGGILEIIFE